MKNMSTKEIDEQYEKSLKMLRKHVAIELGSKPIKTKMLEAMGYALVPVESTDPDPHFFMLCPDCWWKNHIRTFIDLRTNARFVICPTCGKKHPRNK